MEYTNIIYPLISIFLTLTIGIIIGLGVSFYKFKDEINSLTDELDAKQKDLEEWINRWRNLYDDDDDEILSECCGRKIKEGTDLCCKCNEHTGIDNI